MGRRNGRMRSSGNAALAAHHGWTGYDESKTVTVTGTIRESTYENPLGTMRLQVGSDGGRLWVVVLAAPARMQGRGLTAEAMKPGTTATAVGCAHRQHAGEMRAEQVTIGDKTTELR